MLLELYLVVHFNVLVILPISIFCTIGSTEYMYVYTYYSVLVHTSTFHTIQSTERSECTTIGSTEVLEVPNVRTCIYMYIPSNSTKHTHVCMYMYIYTKSIHI